MVVLACLGTGILEVGLFISAVHTSQPNWSLAITASRAGMVTSAASLVAGVVGARQKPTIGISELGVVAGIFGLFLTAAVEAVTQICWVCV